ncbi:MAG: hypothetical protein LLG05_03315 [Porphyromonadaceae bacterium]|nr:hypothetical protein [Porphyromonadaceae bacterium]
MKDVEIHFTDEQGNEWYVKTNEQGETQVFKNKTQITDVRTYIDDLTTIEREEGMFIDDEEWEKEMGK